MMCRIKSLGDTTLPARPVTLMRTVFGTVTGISPVRMAKAFRDAIDAGRAAYEAGLIEPRDMAEPSTPVAGTPFFDLSRRP